MHKLLFLISFGLLQNSCTNQVTIGQSELKQIYKDILMVDSLEEKFYLIDSIENFDKKTITQSGTTYSVAYCDNEKKGVWTDNLFDSLILISADKLHSLPNPGPFTMTPAYYSFSLPYFSKDKKSFLLYYNLYCGNLCAEYSLRLYKKINGKWTFIKSYFRMVS